MSFRVLIRGQSASLPVLREAAQRSPHGSVIVNLASTAGLVGSTQDPLYSMTKGRLTLFTKSTALEFARKGYRIRVNSMHPGTIDTPPGQHTPSVRPLLRPASSHAGGNIAPTRSAIGRGVSIADRANSQYNAHPCISRGPFPGTQTTPQGNGRVKPVRSQCCPLSLTKPLQPKYRVG